VTSHHPAEVDLFDLAIGRIDRGEVFAARAHVERPCRLCAKRLADLQRTARALEDVRESQSVVNEPLPFEAREDGASAAKRRENLEALARLSDDADARSVALVDAAGAGPDALSDALSALEGDAARPLTLLYAAQRAGKLAASDPNAALDLARRLQKAAPSLPSAAVSSKSPATAELLEGEALLLESHCLLAIGFVKEAIEKVAEAREAFVAADDRGFSEAVCNYFEGSAAGFAGQFARAERLLKNALGVFADFGQDQWMGRAEAALGLVLSQRGDHERAVHYIDRGLKHLSPDMDANSYVASLVNKGSALIHLERFDEARGAYAEALAPSLKHGLRHLTFGVRMGLSELSFHRGDFARALQTFRRLVDEADASGYVEDALCTRLYVAECLGRMGRESELAGVVDDIRHKHRLSPFAQVEALEELFLCFDRGDLDAGLIAHVREYVKWGPARRNYTSLRQAG
jgi:tetratricopeptide (TPR) repeat protein